MKSFLSFWDRPTGQGAFLGLITLGLVLVMILFVPTRAGATDDFVVSIFADGQSRTFRTGGGTVGSVLEKAGVKITDDDLVEPAVETELTGPVFNVNIFRARPVRVVDGIKSYVINTPYSSSKLIAEDAGLKVYPEDELVLNRVDDFVGAGIIGEQLIVNRAVSVVIELYGKRIEHRTHAKTVGELLAEKEIVPDSEDFVSQSDETPISDGLKVSIIRVGKLVEVVEEVIAFDSEVIWDDSVSYGYESVERAGSNGERTVTYEVEYHNGQEVSRRQLKVVVSVEPVSEVVRVGTSIPDGIENRVIGQQLASANGWEGEQWICLLNLWDKESKWNHLSQNPYSSAYGIPQFLDGTWSGTGYQKSSDPATQILAGMVYIENRYGTPCGAWQHSVAYNWY